MKFLERFHPDRTWVLTAIAPDRKSIVTKAFKGKGADAWIKKYEGKRNLYFSVNEVINAEDKKAEKENIAAVHWLHVDIDARDGHDILEELGRIKKSVTTNLPSGVPEPTCVIFSGGGYQAFWRLKEPIPIQGNKEAWTHAERYNRQLILLFDGGDNCHNVDRIMRLPDTLNIPNANKVAKGRVPIKAEILYFNDNSYDLKEFDQAAEVGLTNDSDIEISGNVPRLNSIDDLNEWSVPDRVKVICVQGLDPDTPKDGDNSRSAWLFDAVCNMLRASVPDEIIYSVITDKGFKISESVLASNNPHKYAVKQIRDGKLHVENPTLREMNSKFAVIGNLGGKCRIIEEVYDESLNRTRLVKSTFEDFRNRHMHRGELTTGDKPKLIPLGKWWLEHAKRRQYDRLVFTPGQEVDGAYNLWRGWGYNAIPGNAHEDFLEHTLEIICAGEKAHYDYLIAWMARAVQHPDQPGQTAFVMRGRPGTGKSFFAKHFGYLFGRHFLHVSNASHLVGNFNSHLRDAILLFGDEAFYAGDKRHESVLKTLITEDTLIIEAKGVDAEASPNYTHLILASNSAWVVPAGAADRRYFVVDVSEAKERDTKYFGGLERGLKNGGYESLLHFLLNYDIRNFDVQDVPETDALDQQKKMTLDPHEDWWFTCLQECRLGAEPWENTSIPFGVLWNSYIEHCTNVQPYKLVNRQSLTLYLQRISPQGYPQTVRRRSNGEAVTMKLFPPVQVCRDSWDRFHKTRTRWDAVEDDENSSELPF